MRVKRGAVEFAVEHRGAAVDDAAADDARGIGRILDHRFPNLLARKRVERDRLFMIGEIDDAVLDQSLRLLAAIVGHAVGPGRYQPFDVVATVPALASGAGYGIVCACCACWVLRLRP